MDWFLALLLVVLLLIKDSWPVAEGIVGIALKQSLSSSPSLGVRNPQVWAALHQAGWIAAGLLVIGALRAAMAARRLSPVTILHWIGLALAAWNGAVAVFLARGGMYGPESHLLAVASKNAAATLSALGVVVATGLTWRAWAHREWIPGLGWLTAVGLGLTAVPLLRSWTGVLGLVAGAIVFGWGACGRRGSRGARLIAGASAGLAVLMLVVTNPTLAARLADLHRDYRLEIWSDCLPLLVAFPFAGSGLGSFAGIYPLFGRLELTFDSRLVHPDSSWVLLAVEWGLPIVLGLLVFAILRLRPSPESAAGESTDVRAIGVAARAALVAWLVCGLTDIALHRPAVALVGATLIALLPPAPGILSRPGPRANLAAAGALFLVALIGIGEFCRRAETRAFAREHFQPEDLRWAPLNPRLHWNAAFAAWNDRGEAEQAIRHLRMAVRLDHRSMAAAATAARLLTGPAPDAAVWFWEQAWQRARDDPGIGLGLLRETLRDFPGPSLRYWEEILSRTSPDLLVALARHRNAEKIRLLWRAWLLCGDSLFERPWVQDEFFAVVRELPAESPLLPALLQQRPNGFPTGFYLRAARLLSENRRFEDAWAALLLAEPIARLLERSPPFTGSEADRQRHALLSERESAGHFSERLRLLELFSARPGAPDWYHIEYARELHRSGRTEAALQRLLPRLPLD